MVIVMQQTIEMLLQKGLHQKLKEMEAGAVGINTKDGYVEIHYSIEEVQNQNQ